MPKNTLYKTLIVLIITGCSSVPEQPKQQPQPAENKLKERAENITRELKRQKNIKENLVDLKILEKFDRTTPEKDVLKELDKPDYIKEIIAENIPQKILYYTQKQYAVWLWKDKTLYTYRATVSLNDGKLDLPLHNVMTEDELRLTARHFSEPDIPVFKDN